jgi:16S rRNA (adenine(1408)-N(1))-methyltransferase
VDANADLLVPVARQAGRKPSRGGVSNLICIAASAEDVSAEIPCLADSITVVLPWARLLRVVAEPIGPDLGSIAALGRTGATFETLFSYDAAVDGRARSNLAVDLTEHHVTQVLPAAYRSAGLCRVETARMTRAMLKAYPTTWVGRLAFGRARSFWRIKAHIEGRPAISLETPELQGINPDQMLPRRQTGR